MYINGCTKSDKNITINNSNSLKTIKSDLVFPTPPRVVIQKVNVFHWVHEAEPDVKAAPQSMFKSVSIGCKRDVDSSRGRAHVNTRTHFLSLPTDRTRLIN